MHLIILYAVAANSTFQFVKFEINLSSEFDFARSQTHNQSTRCTRVTTRFVLSLQLSSEAPRSACRGETENNRACLTSRLDESGWKKLLLWIFRSTLKSVLPTKSDFFYWRCKPMPSKAIKKVKKTWTRFYVRKGSGRSLKTGFLSLSLFLSHSLNSCRPSSLSFPFISFLTSFSLLSSTCTFTILLTSGCLEYSGRKCSLNVITQ